MANHITGIDHVLIGVADLERARASYERLGFTLTPRGRHVGWGTANYCVMFARSYLELIGVVGAREGSAGLDGLLARGGEGLKKLALASDDAERARADLVRAGVGVSAVESLSRALELPTGKVFPSFRLVHLAAEATPDLSAFVCQHLTPDLVRRPEWLKHPNGAEGLAAVTVVVDEPLRLAEAYDRVFGAGASTPTDDTLAVFTGSGAILFVTPADLEVLHPDVDYGAPRPTPHIAAMRLTTPDPATAARHLEAAGVPFSLGRDFTVRVAPALAHGVLIEFGPPGARAESVPH
jgi:catechol 2,3-dioxygenase-like lactoylglutathione lyase family enzyme